MPGVRNAQEEIDGSTSYVVDTPVVRLVPPADVQDRDGAYLVRTQDLRRRPRARAKAACGGADVGRSRRGWDDPEAATPGVRPGVARSLLPGCCAGWPDLRASLGPRGARRAEPVCRAVDWGREAVLRIWWPLLTFALVGCERGTTPAEVRIFPADPLTTDDLHAEVSGGENPRGDAVTWTLAWTVDGDGVPEDGRTIPAVRTQRGQVWAVTAIPSSGDELGEAVKAEVTIGDTPPALTLSFEPAAPVTGEALAVVVGGTDADGDPIAAAVEIRVDDVPLGGADGRVAAGLLMRGERVHAVARQDGVVVEGDVVVGNAPPRVSLTVEPGSPRAAEVPVASAEVLDPEGDAVTTAWSWTVDGVAAGAGTSPEGALRKGQVLVVDHTAADGVGVTTTRWQGTVANTPPAAEGAQVEASPSRATGARCLVSGMIDVDGDAVSPVVRWTVSGTPVVPVGEWLDGSEFRRGDLVACRATPHDGTDGGDEVVSAPEPVVNSLPVLGGLSLSPAEPRTDSTIVALLGLRTDADGDPVSTAVTWTVDGVDEGQAPFLSADRFRRGQVVRATATPTDGFSFGVPLVAEVVIRNAPPQVRGVMLSPDPPYGAVETVAVVAVDDADGDVVDLRYTWSVDGVMVQDGPSDRLPPESFAAGQAVSVVVEATDGIDRATGSAGPALARNSPPRLRAVTVNPTVLAEGDEAHCVIDAADPEGDPFVVLSWWTVDGLDVPGSPTVLNSAWFDRGQEVRCVAAADDGLGDPVLLASNPVVVSNTPPELAGLTFDPGVPLGGVLLTAVALGLYDVDPPDQGLLSLDVTWTVDGQEVGTGPVLPAGTFRRGQEVQAVAVAVDGIGRGASQVHTVVAGNSPPVVRSVVVGPLPAFGDIPLVAEVVADDADLDPVDLAYQWRVNGVVQDVVGAELPPGLARRGDRVDLAVTPSDLFVAGAVAHAVTVVLSDRPPSLPTVQITPAFAMPGQDRLRCRVTVEAVDPDADAVTYAFAWTLDELPYAGPFETDEWPDDVVPAAALAEGQRWRCSVVAYDRAHETVAVTADARVVQMDLRDLAAGDDVTCGVDVGGRVRCWGYNGGTEAMPPSMPLTGLSSGFDTSCGLTVAGGLRCWGANDALVAPPAGTFQQVDVGEGHACAVRASGAVVCWGANTFGEASPPPSMARTTWAEVAAGASHACARSTAGEIRCWGRDADGQLLAPEGAGWTAIDAALDGTCALDAGGAVTCWGALAGSAAPEGLHARALRVGPSDACALGVDDTLRCWGGGLAALLDGAEDVIDVALGSQHACLLDLDGEVRCDEVGGRGANLPPTVPVLGVVAGQDHLCGEGPDGVVCWGSDEEGQASPPPGLVGVTLFSGSTHTCAYGAADLSCWGDDGFGQAHGPAGVAVVAGDAGSRNTCVVTAAGDLLCWGDGTDGLLLEPVGGPWSEVSVGDGHACAIGPAGVVTCWGRNLAGEVVAPSVPFLSLAAAPLATCGVVADTTLRCWGAGAVTVGVPAGAGFVQVVAGDGHACALRADGSVTCWGDDSAGRADPWPGTYTSLVAGDDTTCGTLTDGSSRCWGVYVW